MSITKIIINIWIFLASGCCAFAYYLSKHEKDSFATVNFVSSGCFNYVSYRLTLTHERGSIIASLDSSGRFLTRTSISRKQLETFYVFVEQLEHIKNKGSCLTTDYYKLNLNEDIIERTDWSCNWLGFRNLIRCFFKKFSNESPYF
jgi:hypothetical protein